MPTNGNAKRRFTLTFGQVVRYAGLAIALYETLVEKVDRPSLLILAAGMMGLDSIIKAQGGDAEKKNGSEKKNGLGEK
jgi:hypothetical protein